MSPVTLVKKHGIKNTLELFDLGFGVLQAKDRITADGKFDLNDLAHVMPVIGTAKDAFEDIHLVPAELGELDTEESAQVLSHVLGKLPAGASNEKAWVIFKLSVRVALVVAEGVTELRSLS